jgi:hypothetical protein
LEVTAVDAKRVIVRLAMLVAVATLAWLPHGRAQQPAARAGDTCTAETAADAALRLGVAYETGLGGGQSYTKAAECYRSAAAAGNAQAQLSLAALYRNGRGVQRDPDQALFWYEKAAEQGDGRAAYALGTMFENGDGVPKHLPTALHWYHIALDRGVADAISKVAALDDDPTARGAPLAFTEKPQAAAPAGEPVPGSEFKDATGRPCRLLQTTVTLDGRSETAYAKICREASGRWVLVPSDAR